MTPGFEFSGQRPGQPVASAGAGQRPAGVQPSRRAGDPTGCEPRPHTRTDLAMTLRLAARALLRRPSYTLLAVGALAIGVAGTTSVYGIVHHVLLEGLPFDDPDRICAIFCPRVTLSSFLTTAPSTLA